MSATAHGPAVMGTRGPVKVIGTGLLGASLGLALRAAGVEVQLADASPQALALARDLGAGEIPDAVSAVDPSIVVVATPPDVAAIAVLEALRVHPGAVVTDVASVKAPVEEEVLSRAAGDTGRAPALDVSRYVGSHPMAGRERSGAAAAHADLFAGRPWVIVPHAASSEQAILAVRTLAADVGSAPVRMGATEHDDAVALVSHLPQLAATLVATRLVDAPDEALALAGQGLRDVTRIAASDPQLWSTILVGNAAPVAAVLRRLRDDLDQLLEPLDRSAAHGPDAPGATGPLARAVAAGNRGVERIPGKHGGAPRRYSEVTALVPDEPGALARLLAEIGEEGVNLEDLHLEHSAGQRVGLARISVLPAAAGPLEKALERRGWQVVAP